MINISTTLGTNTGKSLGDVRMGRIKHIILTRGKEFTAEELADSDALMAAIIAGIQQPRTSVNKLFVFTGFREAEDKTGDPQTGTLGDGYEEVLNEAIPKIDLKHTAGVAQTQSFVTFNGWSDKFYFIDDQGILWYRDTSSEGGKGFTLAGLYASYPRPGGTGNIVTGLVKLTLASADEFKSAVGAVKLGFNIAELPEIVDVALMEVAGTAGYVFNIAAKRKYAGTNIYETYKTLLAQKEAWEITKKDGTPVAVEACAADDTLNGNKGGWKVTADDTTPIAADTELFINLKSPAVLAELALPTEGIEGIRVKVVKP